MTTADKLYETVRDLPEPILAEILDFTEFLRMKVFNEQIHTSNELLENLAGGLENSVTFAGEPLVIQQQLRDEWN